MSDEAKKVDDRRRQLLLGGTTLSVLATVVSARQCSRPRRRPPHRPREPPAGIGFVGNSPYAFGPLLFAQGALLSAWIADRVVRTKLTVLDFKIEVVLLIGAVVFAILLPLAVFLPKLAEARRQGRRKYGLLAAQYTQAFERKWIDGATDADEPLLGTSDIQSLADMGGSYQQVQDTRLLPFGVTVISHLVFMTALPLLPLVFSVLSFDSIIMRLFKILF